MAEEIKDTQLEQSSEEILENTPKETKGDVIDATAEIKIEDNGKKQSRTNKFGRRSGKKFDKGKEEKPEFEQKLLDIRRTARMVAGGRRFNFRALVVIGNKKGRVGVGLAKGADVTVAVEKAVNQAKKVLIDIPITEDKSISQMVEAKFGAAKVMLKPAQKGRGIIAGGAVRVICSLAGIENVVSKIIGRTTNRLNNAQAAIEALKKLS